MMHWLLSKLMAWALTRPKNSFIWAYIIDDVRTGDPYLPRLLFPRIRIGSVDSRPMLHNFKGPDGDRNPHNHPWKWAVSIILSGSYTEERTDVNDYVTVTNIDGTPRKVFNKTTRRVRWFNRLNENTYHRVTQLHGNVWTLFIVGPKIQSWGFLHDDSNGEHEDWKPYLERLRAEYGVQKPEQAYDETAD